MDTFTFTTPEGRRRAGRLVTLASNQLIGQRGPHWDQTHVLPDAPPDTLVVGRFTLELTEAGDYLLQAVVAGPVSHDAPPDADVLELGRYAEAYPALTELLTLLYRERLESVLEAQALAAESGGDVFVGVV